MRWTLLILLLHLGCAREPWIPDVHTYATPGSEPRVTYDYRPGDALDGREVDGGRPEELPSYPAPIAMDGQFEDWQNVPVLHEDPVGDAGDTGIDLAVIKAAHDANYLYLYFDTGAEISLGNNQFLTLYIDADDDPATGYEVRGLGAELQWVFGQRGGKVFRPGGMTPVQFSDIGFQGHPAVTSTRFEVAISRHHKPGGTLLLPGGTVALVLADHTWNGQGVEDGDAAPTLGQRVRYELSSEVPPPPVSRGLERSPGTTLRVVSWNSLYTGVLDPERAPHFRRVLKALDPDVICLQEAWYGTETAAVMDEWLPLEEGHWQVSSFANQVTLSRYPIVWGWPGGFDLLPDNIVQTTVELPGEERLIIFNAHLAWGDQDAERQREADAFVAYLRALFAGEAGMAVPAGTPFIFLGDLNLVGDAQQLVTLLTGDIVNEAEFGPDAAPDWDGSGLVAPVLLQTEQRMGYTWRAQGGSYWPGRLDYALLPDSVLQLAGGFLVHTPAMSQESLGLYGLHDDDTTAASDHLPLVLDLAW